MTLTWTGTSFSFTVEWPKYRLRCDERRSKIELHLSKVFNGQHSNFLIVTKENLQHITLVINLIRLRSSKRFGL
ncbi:CLUMA_CG007575, isoform A [Clunio marinus]|uniref:CLUMA_CG007575, isoform A n=1 Tax=Clunio marinus TaxID=568069 RepID=A0A1J1I1G8_9DIPT|nr:CLUMA_CG007575, isoform A [Clunio marinus]